VERLSVIPTQITRHPQEFALHFDMSEADVNAPNPAIQLLRSRYFAGRPRSLFVEYVDGSRFQNILSFSTMQCLHRSSCPVGETAGQASRPPNPGICLICHGDDC
jgi:hypothetical protein